MRVGGAVLGLWLVVLTSLVAPSLAAEEAPVVPLPAKLAKELQPLGAGVVGAALAAHPITDPSRLRHVDPGVWVYEVVEGPRDGQREQVTVSKEGRTDEGENVKLVFGSSGEVQHLEVRYDHVVAKRSQLDAGSNRRVVYRPGLVLEPRMQVGETKQVQTDLSTYRGAEVSKVEYDGQVDYSTTYVGAYRVTTPAGKFETRLLVHEYEMNIGPARAHYRSLGFYAEGVGMVAEVSNEKVTALLLYRRSDRSARVLVELPDS